MPAVVYDLTELRERTGVFTNRHDAGRQLAVLLQKLELSKPLLLGIPAGGVPVAVSIAEQLDWPLDVAVVSKIVLPWNSEVGYGAVAFDGSWRLNEELVRVAALDDKAVEQGIAATRAKVARRVELLRGKRAFPDLSDRQVVVVDDGLASGFTLLVAVQALRRASAAQIIIAVPTALNESLRRVAPEVETICCANLRSGTPYAVASAYHNWYDLSENEVLEQLRAAGVAPD